MSEIPRVNNEPTLDQSLLDSLNQLILENGGVRSTVSWDSHLAEVKEIPVDSRGVELSPEAELDQLKGEIATAIQSCLSIKNRNVNSIARELAENNKNQFKIFVVKALLVMKKLSQDSAKLQELVEALTQKNDHQDSVMQWVGADSEIFQTMERFREGFPQYEAFMEPLVDECLLRGMRADLR